MVQEIADRQTDRRAHYNFASAPVGKVTKYNYSVNDMEAGIRHQQREEHHLTSVVNQLSDMEAGRSTILPLLSINSVIRMQASESQQREEHHLTSAVNQLSG